MILKAKCEFRGKEERQTDKGIYYFINLEDETGNACKFPCVKFEQFDNLKKGDNVDATIDYNFKYGSLKVVNCEKGGSSNGNKTI